MRLILNRVYFVLIFVFLVGCKPYYYGSKGKIDNVVNFYSSSIIEKPSQINFAGELVGNRTNKFSIKSVFFNDSIYQFKVYSKALGIEIGRLQVFSDSAIYIDKINKKYYKGKVCNLPVFNNIDFKAKNLTKLLFGRIFGDTSYSNLLNLDSINYSFRKFNIIHEFNKSGLIFRTGVKNGSNSFDFLYEKYYRKNYIPGEVEITMDKGEKFYLRITSISDYNSSFKQFKINSKYSVFE